MFRLLPYEIAPGPHNMAADEALLAAAAQQSLVSLRGYSWSEATVSLGYFQPAAERERAGLAALPFVRRPSGGATLVHHHELTYGLALPAGFVQSGPKWLRRMHEVIKRALDGLGLAGKLRLAENEAQRHGDVLCFLRHTPGDILCESHKIVGSAQRKQRQCLLQHGGILLAQSDHTPELPGIRELTGVSLTPEQVMAALIEEFEKETGWQRQPTYWNAQDQASIAWLLENRYLNPAWNEKR